jgi:hypothetical protein
LAFTDQSLRSYLSKEERNMMNELNIPADDHATVLWNDRNREMIETWSEIAVDLDARTLIVFAEGDGRSLTDVFPTLAYAHVARAAFGLCSVADIAGAEFDWVLFGDRCASIAREQLDRYRHTVANDKSEAA